MAGVIKRLYKQGNPLEMGLLIGKSPIKNHLFLVYYRKITSKNHVLFIVYFSSTPCLMTPEGNLEKTSARLDLHSLDENSSVHW
jgi:hypothetical protein